MSTPGVPERVVATVQFVTMHSVVTTTVLIVKTDEDDMIEQAYELVLEELRSEFEYDSATVLHTEPQEALQ